jgi:hypothetical protein
VKIISSSKHPYLTLLATTYLFNGLTSAIGNQLDLNFKSIWLSEFASNPSKNNDRFIEACTVNCRK